MRPRLSLTFLRPPSSLFYVLRPPFARSAAPRFPAALLRSLSRALQLGNTQLCEQLRINQNVVDNTLALCKFKDGVAKQTDSHTLRNAFNDVWQKVHLQLRCEHVPKFLVSAAFRTINSQFEEWADASKHPELEAGHDPVEASIAAMQNLDIATIMQQPFALDCFERFLRSSQVDGETEGNKAEAADNAWTLVCLIQEVENFKISTTADQRSKRAARIHLRYGSVELVGDAAATAVLGSDPAGTTLDTHNYDGVMDSALKYLQDSQMAGFRDSVECKSYAQEMSGSYMLARRGSTVPAAAAEQTDRCNENLHALQQISADRGYEVVFKGMDGAGIDQFQAYLENPALLVYFKKYAMMHFSAESIMFWVEAEEFRRGAYVRPLLGSFIPGSDRASEGEARRLRAARLCEKYVKSDGRYEVNIDHKMKAQIMDAVEGGDFPFSEDRMSCILFEAAKKEIFKLMKLNLWEKFKVDPIYNESLQKVISKHAAKMLGNGSIILDKYASVVLRKTESKEDASLTLDP